MDVYTKEQLRKLIKERRGQAAPSDLDRDSEIIFRKLRETDEYLMASSIYCYVDFNNEVRTRTFIAQAIGDGKQVAVPRINGSRMAFYYIDSLRQLEPGTMGIPEPKKDTERARSASALMIMPGVAFDRDCHRVGRGGGYYDRFLQEEPTHVTIAVAFEFQLFDEVPHEETDVSPQQLFTESRRFRRY